MSARPGLPVDSNLAFQDNMVALVRALGLHKPDQTPCGQPVSVGEAHALVEVAREAGITQNGLGQRLRLDLEKSTVSRIAGLFERRGWITRDRDPVDTRYVRLRLTAAGRKTNAAIASARAAKFAKVFETLPQAKRGAIIASIAELVELRCSVKIKSAIVLTAMLAIGPLAVRADVTALQRADVEAKGSQVVPFSQEDTMHMFKPTNTGGVQTVFVHDSDPRQIALVRSHLRKEATAFAHGDYTDPAKIHGATMPGLAAVHAGSKRLTIRYEDIAKGASITYTSADPKLIAAVHTWFCRAGR